MGGVQGFGALWIGQKRKNTMGAKLQLDFILWILSMQTTFIVFKCWVVETKKKKSFFNLIVGRASVTGVDCI